MPRLHILGGPILKAGITAARTRRFTPTDIYARSPELTNHKRNLRLMARNASSYGPTHQIRVAMLHRAEADYINGTLRRGLV